MNLAVEDLAAPLAAFFLDPRIGMLLTGDSVQAEEACRALAARLPAGSAGVFGPADDLWPGPPADAVVVVSPLIFDDPARVARVRRVRGVVTRAPGVGAVPAAVAERCGLVVVFDPTPGPEALAMPAPLEGAVTRAITAVHRASPPADPAAGARAAVEGAVRFGLVGHELEYRAGLAAVAAIRLGLDPEAFLERWVFAPRIEKAAAPPPPPDREDFPGAGANRAGSDGSADGTTSVEPPDERVRFASELATRRGRVKKPLPGRRGPRGPHLHGGAPGRTLPWRHGERVDVPATIAQALPRAGLRGWRPGEKLRLLPGDLRTRRRHARTGSLLVIVVDASGSMAQGAIRRAKGLAISALDRAYVDRASVAIIAARGREARVVLPPTRAIARARGALRELPSGGGTPLASAYLAALRLAARYERSAVRVVVMSDGRANVPLTPGGDPGAEAEGMLALLQRAALVEVLGARALSSKR